MCVCVCVRLRVLVCARMPAKVLLRCIARGKMGKLTPTQDIDAVAAEAGNTGMLVAADEDEEQFHADESNGTTPVPAQCPEGTLTNSKKTKSARDIRVEALLKYKLVEDDAEELKARGQWWCWDTRTSHVLSSSLCRRPSASRSLRRRKPTIGRLDPARRHGPACTQPECVNETPRP